MSDPVRGVVRRRPPWDIGRPQQAFVRLAETGADQRARSGCGLRDGRARAHGGELGLTVTGVDRGADRHPAWRKARRRSASIDVRFLEIDALDLGALGEQYDTVLDCGRVPRLRRRGPGRFVDSVCTP